MSKILILDGNNLCHRAFHAMGRMSYQGKGTGAIFGFLNILGGNVSKFKPKKIFVCWDDGRNKHRMKLLPGYKKRDPKLGMDYEDFHRQKFIIMELCRSLGIAQCYYKNREADDFIFSLVKKHLKKKKNRIVIASGDKDFRQLVQNRVLIHDENKGIISPLNFKKLFGILPEQYSNYLSLIGDSSDKIPGVPGFGDKTALKFLLEFSDFKNYLRLCKADPKNKIKKHDLLIEVMARNRLLIDLPDFDMEYGPFKVRFLNDEKKPKRKIKRYKKLCAQNGINKFATDQYIDKI